LTGQSGQWRESGRLPLQHLQLHPLVAHLLQTRLQQRCHLAAALAAIAALIARPHYGSHLLQRHASIQHRPDGP